MTRLRPTGKSAVFCLVGVVIALVYYATVINVVDKCNENVYTPRRIDWVLSQLTILKKEVEDTSLIDNAKIAEERALDIINHMINSLKSEERDFPIKTNVVESSTVLEVCPEEWHKDFPYFLSGWTTVKCSNAKPFNEVLSILLNPPKDEVCSSKLKNIVKNVQETHPSVQVLIPNIDVNCLEDDVDLRFVQSVKVKEAHPGAIWNRLVSRAKTPYVLIGRDLDNFLWLSQLDRQVRMISYSNNAIAVSGGSFRNLTGHWQVGCYQSNMYNYILEYKEGYYRSKNECMFCDHLMGPFVARTSVLQRVKFDENLNSSVLFEDFFIMLKKDRVNGVVNCPDAMYLSTDATIQSKSSSKETFLPLAQKWSLNRIVYPNGNVYHYSCTDSGIECNIFEVTNSYLLPPCCIEQFSESMRYFHNFCVKNNLLYEIWSGQILGVVKMYDLMPWDLDGDIMFYNNNFSIYEQNFRNFNMAGFPIDTIEKMPQHQSNYFRLNSPDIYSEMWGVDNLTFDVYWPEIFRKVPTLVPFHDHWLYGGVSPGAYSRNRYQNEILKHAHSWLQLGMKTSWESYQAGKFKLCKKPGHHACLDQFSPDGNIQFKIPN